MGWIRSGAWWAEYQREYQARKKAELVERLSGFQVSRDKVARVRDRQKEYHATYKRPTPPPALPPAEPVLRFPIQKKEGTK